MLSFKIDGQKIECTERPVTASGYIDTNEASFTFCERWAGLVKVAQFTQKQDGRKRTFDAVIGEDGIAKIPNELRIGRATVSVFGQMPGQTERITTTKSEILIEESGFDPDGQTPIPPTPDLYSQLLQKIKEMQESGVSDDQIAEAVKKYLTENPIVGVEIDETLSKAGSAADAKSTGDALNALNQAIDSKLDASELPTAVNDALAQAKASGEFDGAPGKDGADGKDGAPGADGAPGSAGEDGGYYTPAVDSDGNLTWTASKTGMPDVAGANIKGPAGDGSSGSGYTLPIASATQLGGVQPVAKTEEMTQPVGVDALGALFTKAGWVGNTQFRLIRTVTIPDDPSTDNSGVSFLKRDNGGFYFAFDTDDDGNPFALSEIIIVSYACMDHTKSDFHFGYGATPVYGGRDISSTLKIGVNSSMVYSWSYSIIDDKGCSISFGTSFGGGSFNSVMSTAKRQSGVIGEVVAAGGKLESIRTWAANLSSYGFAPGSQFVFIGR